MPTFSGNVDVRDVTLAFRVGGRVEAVEKGEGDRVEAGELLARIEPAPLQAELDRAEAAVAVAKAELARAEAGNRREEVAEAQAAVAERRAASAQADEAFARTERLLRGGAVAQQAFDDARAGRDRARAALSASQATFAKVAGGARPEDLEILRAKVDQARSAANVAAVALVDAELYAPSSGVVVTRAVEPGSIVANGAPVLVVAFDDPIWIRAYATEKEIAELSPGTAVDVLIDARPDRPYAGRVGYVATQAEFTPKNVETAELRTSLVYRFRVIVDEHDEALRQGMPVTVRLGSRPPAPRVPAVDRERAVGVVP